MPGCLTGCWQQQCLFSPGSPGGNLLSSCRGSSGCGPKQAVLWFWWPWCLPARIPGFSRDYAPARKARPCLAMWAIPGGTHGQCWRGGGGLASAARASPLNGLWKTYLLGKLVASHGRIWHGRLEWKILTACKKVWLVLLWGNQQLAGIQLVEETPELLCERAGRSSAVHRDGSYCKTA